MFYFAIGLRPFGCDFMVSDTLLYHVLCTMYSANSADMNCGPLSDVRLSGRPCCANTSSRLEMTLEATVDFRMSTS